MQTKNHVSPRQTVDSWNFDCVQTCAPYYTKEQYKMRHPHTQGIFFSHLPMDDLQLCHIEKKENSLRKGWCKPRIMFHHCVNRLMVTNLTKCKPVHHITPREHTKCAILMHTNEDSSMKYGIIILSWFTNSRVNPKPNANQHLHGPSNIISFYPCVHSSFTRVVTIDNCKGIVTYMNHLGCLRWSMTKLCLLAHPSQGIHIFIMKNNVNLINCIDKIVRFDLVLHLK
jgi:hypothetical protein